MVAIPEGWFWMGSLGAGQECERPRHRVWVEAFRLARYQVTNTEYAKFLAETCYAPSKYWGHPNFSSPRQPVVAVSWDDAMAYCRWLGAGFRLPTEAEWERAARANEDGREYPWGDDPPQTRPDYASRWLTGPEPVGTSPENAFGLDAMGENVHEWCMDSYDPAFYARSPERNPRCQDGTGRRASRGGSWRHQIKIARCSARSSIPPQFQYADYGLRVAYSTMSIA